MISIFWVIISTTIVLGSCKVVSHRVHYSDELFSYLNSSQEVEVTISYHLVVICDFLVVFLKKMTLDVRFDYRPHIVIIS